MAPPNPGKEEVSPSPTTTAEPKSMQYTAQTPPTGQTQPTQPDTGDRTVPSAIYGAPSPRRLFAPATQDNREKDALFLQRIVSEYKLPDGTDESLLKALRRAAASARFKDVHGLCPLVSDVDASIPQEGSKTALHRAVLNNDNLTVQLLLKWNADKNIRDQDKKSPLDYAKELEDDTILRIFTEPQPAPSSP